MDTQPARKRARPTENDGQTSDEEQTSDSDENPETNPPITRSSDYWFEDGSIILHAESTQFRVHRSILARHSIVFRDMFEMPQPNHGEPEVEGCLIVQLSDSAEDISQMLSSIYDRGNIPRPSFALVSAMLRLGKKYDIGYQYQEALAVLRRIFPSSFTQWKAAGSDSIPKHIQYVGGINFDLINLALETDTLSILPAAYLSLANKFSTDLIARGIMRQDESHAAIPSGAYLACILGRDKVLMQMTAMTFSWLSRATDHHATPPSAMCSTREDCLFTSYRLASEMLETSELVDSLTFFKDLTKWKSFASFCDNCSSSARSAHDAVCRRMWLRLPECYGLGDSWEDILLN